MVLLNVQLLQNLAAKAYQKHVHDFFWGWLIINNKELDFYLSLFKIFIAS